MNVPRVVYSIASLCGLVREISRFLETLWLINWDGSGREAFT